MFVKGLKTISVTGKNDGAMWYGKINTTVFYVVMVLLVLCPGIPDLIAEYLLLVCGVSMLLAWFMYARYYCEELKNNNKKKQIYEKRETVQ
jgi:cardiolipin synthase